ncbi:biotin/lipoyl-containing protein [Moorella sp. Hama-1]|uniref:biotin/lipoyl-containing protein n=1 Tax=Moorella sp. Hama-1 TaxID=2138101 RepID=UPI000D654F39|nr:biotin/lipoyl-containing protein [Moorella sp. Hama-1]BCV21241.1 acetyl-CoA carboxylase biotin carboxyl carrier protein subunit [Moorella sp. Hama-1]
MKRHFQVTVNGETFQVEVEEHQEPAGQPAAPAVSLAPGPGVIPKPGRLAAAPPAPTRDNRTITAPLPGTVVEVKVKPGQRVTAGQVLIIIEAMKMENEIPAPTGGVVREVLVEAGATVSSGQPLVTLA